MRRRRGPTLLGLFFAAYLLWSLVPAAIAMLFSFNDGKSRSQWQGFSLRWWTDGSSSVLHGDVFRSALEQSLTLAVLDVVIAVPLGIALAIALSRWFGRGSAQVALLATIPLVIPELVLAIALFLLITQLLTFVHLGTVAQVIGQVTFTMPFVIVIARARLASITPELEEAAMDLGASPSATMWLVLVRLLQPAIVAGAVIAFALSVDNFVITQYMASDESTQTVPMLIYTSARGSATPALNATATSLVIFTAVFVALGGLLYRALSRRQAGVRA